MGWWDVGFWIQIGRFDHVSLLSKNEKKQHSMPMSSMNTNNKDCKQIRTRKLWIKDYRILSYDYYTVWAHWLPYNQWQRDNHHATVESHACGNLVSLSMHSFTDSVDMTLLWLIITVKMLHSTIHQPEAAIELWWFQSIMASSMSIFGNNISVRDHNLENSFVNLSLAVAILSQGSVQQGLHT